VPQPFTDLFYVRILVNETARSKHRHQ
jgi:hypothetical protein